MLSVQARMALMQAAARIVEEAAPSIGGIDAVELLARNLEWAAERFLDDEDVS